jgi:hypothetical protein
MSSWTTRQQKVLGWYYFLVALITLVIAVIQQPVGDWGGWGLLLGAAMALLGLVGLWQGVTGKGNTRSTTMSESRQRVWAIVGLVAVTLAVVVSIISDMTNWTASDTITVGIWVALLGLFVSQLATLSKD